MAQAIISNQSRYSFRPLIRETSRSSSLLRIQSFRGISRSDFSDNMTIRIKSSDRLDLLSFELYGTSRFDWVLAAFNNLKLPFEDLKGKQTIIAPSRETLFDTIIPDLQLQLAPFLK